MDDGEVQKTYMAYRNRLDLIEGIGTNSRDDAPSIVEDLKNCLRALIVDKEFLLKSKFKLYTLPYKHMYICYAHALSIKAYQLLKQIMQRN